MVMLATRPFDSRNSRMSIRLSYYIYRRTAAGKKSNKKDKKADYSAVINEAEEAIILFFQNINYGDLNEVEAQLITELEVTTLNTNEVIITRSGRIRRAPVRFRNT